MLAEPQMRYVLSDENAEVVENTLLIRSIFKGIFSYWLW